MRELTRRVEQLEQELAASACACAKTPWVRRIYRDGVRTDNNLDPAPLHCPLHGPVALKVIIREFVTPRHREAPHA